jgi:DNA repair protein RadC
MTEGNSAIYKLVLKREAIPCKLVEEAGMLRNSEAFAEFIRKLTKDEVQEVGFALYFMGPGKLIGYSEIARGGMEWCTWDPKIMFATALLCGATSIVMAHNHPSGSARPSRADVKSMKKVIPAGQLLGIRVLDHIVVSQEQYVSMQDFGLLPPSGELEKEAEKEREKALDGREAS